MTIANLQIPEDLILDPMLADLVKQLSMDKPNWFFRERKRRTGRSYFKHKLNSHGLADAPEGKSYLREVDVIQDGRSAGTVAVDIEYRYRGENRLNYVVCSDRINNGRKGNVMRTTKLDVAVRNAKKHFDPPKTGELLWDAAQAACESRDRVLSELSNAIHHHRMSGSNSVLQMQQFVRAMLSGQPVDKQLESELRTELFSPKYEETLANYMLADAMRGYQYVALSLIEGDYHMFADGEMVGSREAAAKATMWYGSFEQLPEEVQNKIAVLQLMQDKELVLDVGFRYNDSTFLIAFKPQ